MSKYLAGAVVGALAAGVALDLRHDGQQTLTWWLPFGLLFLVLGWTVATVAGGVLRRGAALGSDARVDARIDGFTSLREDLLGHPLCRVNLTVHSTAFEAYRTDVVTLDRIRELRGINDEISVVRPSPRHPDVLIHSSAEADHEFGLGDSVAPPGPWAALRPGSALGTVAVPGESSGRPRSVPGLVLRAVTILVATALGAFGWYTLCLRQGWDTVEGPPVDTSMTVVVDGSGEAR